MAAHNELGKEGEEVAVRHLISKGYTILHRNWRSRNSELDIVAEKDQMLVVVEVKTRTSSRFGNPEESINERKIRRIVSSTDAYLKKFHIDLSVRFDIITVVGNQAPFQIEHICDAFLPPLW